MFLRLKLTNFRKHRDVEITYTAGVNAIRGVNEIGKTTLGEAACYCMFGAKWGLREPLEKVVTWGEKLSSLRVEMDMQINSVTYCGKRSKTGAEVWLQGGTAPLVTGQDECTRFWETLIGTSAKVCTSLMVANQQAIRGTLEGGAKAPVELIEKLANFKLIDTIINLVMEKIPNGQTKLVEDRIGRLKEELGRPEEDLGIEQLQQAAHDADGLLQAAQVAEREAQEAVTAFRPTALAAQQAINEHQAAVQRRQQAVANHQRAIAAKDAITVPAAPDTSALEGLRQQLTDKGAFQRAKQAKAALDRLGTPEAEWDEGMQALLAAKSQAATGKGEAGLRMQNLQVKLAQTQAQKITQTACGLCGKDLSAVPEVVTKNAELDEQIAALQGDINNWSDRLADAGGTEADLEAVLADARRRATTYQQCAAFIELDEKYVPARWRWIGPDLSVEPSGDPAGEIARIEAAQRAHDQAAGALRQAEDAVIQAGQAVTEAQALQIKAEDKAVTAELDLKEAEQRAGTLAAAAGRVQQARQGHQQAAGALATAQAVHRERQAARERLRADLKAAEVEVERTRKGNVLLGKLRSAKPQVADKLWSAVLASVSTYFSQIRGVKSVVTRADNGFQVDGHDIEGLSGSTLDALGLAIRLALTKTFLPNARFLVLDEASAACDEGREANMAGLVAASDFDQVVWATHSEQIESFAHNVIRL